MPMPTPVPAAHLMWHFSWAPADVRSMQSPLLLVCSVQLCNVTTRTWRVLVTMAAAHPSCQFVICIKHRHVRTKVYASSSVVTAAPTDASASVSTLCSARLVSQIRALVTAILSPFVSAQVPRDPAALLDAFRSCCRPPGVSSAAA
jgi:hypothetical protein